MLSAFAYRSVRENCGLRLLLLKLRMLLTFDLLVNKEELQGQQAQTPPHINPVFTDTISSVVLLTRTHTYGL